MVFLFVLRNPGLARHFEGAIAHLLAARHVVHVCYPNPSKDVSEDTARLWAEDVSLDRLASTFPQMSHGYIRRFVPDEASAAVKRVRQWQDYLRYAEPEYVDAESLRVRVERQMPEPLQALMRRWPLSTAPGRRMVAKFLAALEAATPPAPSAVEQLEAVAPDVVIVSPLVDFGSDQVEFLKAARLIGIHTALCVASWDNLTNKGLMRIVPDLVTVWNEAQAEEARRFHAVPPEDLAVTGAPTFDFWFDHQNPTPRRDFMGRLGLDPDKPLILYLGSSSFIGGDENEIFEQWLAACRRANPDLASANVLIRPHPKHIAPWKALAAAQSDTITVWPPDGAVPIDELSKQALFDSIYHAAAVVGLNTSAQIEAAILGKPVFAWSDPAIPQTLKGTRETLHYAHLVGDEQSGAAVAATSLAEHARQLSDALGNPAEHNARASRFVQTFIRPHGDDVTASRRLADALVRLGQRARPEPVRLPYWAPAAGPVLRRLAEMTNKEKVGAKEPKPAKTVRGQRPKQRRAGG